MKNRIELAEEFARRGFTHGAEIGVADGRYSEILFQKIPGLTLHCIDPWAKYDGNWRSDSYQDGAMRRAVGRLMGKNAIMHKKTSLEASTMPLERPLDFVFIDGAHDFDNVMLDIILWTPKVRKGGIVSGHDAYFFNGGVIPAVYSYVQAHQIELNIIPRSSDGHKDDRAPCWWFEK